MAGFSLVELVVVLAVTLLLTALLLPALSQVRESVNRVVCSSNQRQFGLAVMMFAKDHRDRLPVSHELLERERRLRLRELTTARLNDPDVWDGLGVLFKQGYCAAAECYYCPSHRGEEVLEPHQWRTRKPTRILTNYHYCGHVDWHDKDQPRRLEKGMELVISVDALPDDDKIPSNHGAGLNTLRGDGSVRWHEDPGDRLTALVREVNHAGNPDGADLWDLLEAFLNGDEDAGEEDED